MKRIILWICYYLGLSGLARYLNRSKVRIIAWHQVVSPGTSEDYRPIRDCLSTEQLKDILSALSKDYNFVSLQHAVKIIKGEAKPVPNAVAITFDDGYRNNLTHGGPVLREFDAPFTIFLTTGLVSQRQPMWVDRLDYAYHHYDGEPVTVNLGDTTVELEVSPDGLKADRFQRFRRTLKNTASDDREFLDTVSRLCDQLEAANGRKLTDEWPEDDWSTLLTWDDIRLDMSCGDGLAGYGSHTEGHVRLARVPSEIVQREVVASRHTIENNLGIPCPYFAYPDGSFDTTAARLVENAGYEAGLTSEEGFNEVGDNLFTLRRVDLPLECSRFELASTMSGLSFFLHNLKRSVWPE